MNAKIDTLGHLPRVYSSPWNYFKGCYERSVSFNCGCGNRRYAILKVYTDDEGASMVFVRLDGVVRELSIGEYADPFSVANETLLALADNCDYHNDLQ